ncbi:O-antigen ligase family protein [Streptomyces sp. TR06-5]|uniref:O-antigen ligase family protein n=1 Tax=unclassified Streptomyces TaxID=2593676 RepID=UPI0039A26E9C
MPEGQATATALLPAQPVRASPPAAPAPPEPTGRRLRRALRSPALPVAATALLLCLPGGAGDTAEGTHVTPADVASALLVLWCAVVLLRGRRRPLALRAVVVIAAPAVAFALATATAPDPAGALLGLVRHLQIFVLVPAAVLLLLRTRRDLRRAAAAVVTVAVVQGAVGVYQYVTATGASYRGSTVRAVGTFGPTDVMGMATVVSYGLVLLLAVALAPPPSAPRRLRPVALGTAAALVVPLAVSFSRGSWIATACAALVMLLFTGMRRAVRSLVLLCAAAVVLVGGAGVGTDMIGERLTSITEVTSAPDQSVTDRYAMWAAATAMWRDNPVTGVGLKGFPDHRDSYASLALSAGSDTAGAGVAFHVEPLLSPHNMYLLVLSEQGLAGFVLVIGGWLALLTCGVRRLRGLLGRTRRTRRTGGSAPDGADCGLAAVGLLVWQLVDFLYADIGGPSTVLTALLFGLAAWWAFAPGAVREEAPA